MKILPDSGVDNNLELSSLSVSSVEIHDGDIVRIEPVFEDDCDLEG